MMLSFFKVRPPLSAGQRVNIELLMRRTIDAIGKDLPKQCDIVGDIADLRLDPSSPTQMLEQAESVIESRFPSVSSTVSVSVRDKVDGGLPSVYREKADLSPAQIEIHAETLTDPLRTVLELANQYSHHFWHSSGHLDPETLHPNLTHLLPICCGLGILASDGAFYDVQWSEGGWQGWAMSRSGYYNASEIGYASALFARHRGESNPVWFKAMRLDSRETAKKASRYFEHCDQNQRPILFDADWIPSTRSSPKQLSEWMGGDDDAFALAAGYALVKMRAPSSLVTESAIRAAEGRNLELVPLALELIGMAHPVSDRVQSLITKLVAHSNHAVSIAALRAASSLGMPITPFRDKISRLLSVYAEGSIGLIDIVAKAGPEFESFDVLICRHLAEAIQYSNDQATLSLLECLHQISPDPTAVIEREILDPELQERALKGLSESM